jgi:Zinc knuckle
MDNRRATDDRLQHLESALQRYQHELELYRSENAWLRQAAAAAPQFAPPTWSLPPPMSPPTPSPAAPPSAAAAGGQRPTPTPPRTTRVPTTDPAAPPTTGTGRRSFGNGKCFGCGETGHSIRECPSKTKAAAGFSGDQHLSSETYIDIEVYGTHCHGLLDTGCELSLIPRKLVPTATLSPTDRKVYAANGSNIPLLGAMTLVFTIQGIPFTADLLVTNFVDELMLGFDWLRTNRCQWLFDQSVLVVGGRRIPLRCRPSH